MGQPYGAPQHSPGGGRPLRAVPFGKYLLLDRVAVGGMAEVFLAKSFGIEGFERFVAIKRILPTMAEDEDFIEMFVDEAKIAGQLTHANIVPIYELGKIGESHYIAMEYVWGKDLLQIMNRFRRMRRRPSPAMVAFVGIKICEGLDYAHHKTDRQGRPLNLIHRDVSPQNILVSYDGHVKVIDFGIAKAASRTTKTQAGVLKGKFGYMSPEQVRGLPIDLRSDVFALGTCLHEFTTGERLFLGESDFTTLEKVRNADVRPPSSVVQGVPPELDQIIMKALARDPEDRWQTAGEMQEALQQFLATQRPPFGTSKLAQWMRSAFGKEIDEERRRMEQYAALGRPHAVAGTSPSPPIEEGEDELAGEATVISASPFELLEQQAAEGGPAAESSAQPMQEEKTVIFFSAEDMDIVEEGPSPHPGPPVAGPPPPAVGLAPPPPSVSGEVGAIPALPPHPAPSPAATGGFAPVPPPQPDAVVAQVPAESTSRTDGTSSRRGRVWGFVAVAVLALAVLGGGVLFLQRGRAATLQVSVRPSDVSGLRIEVDGQSLGGAPAQLGGLEPGPHVVKVTAKGYEPLVRRVDLSEGAILALELALTKKVEPQPSPSPAVAEAHVPPPAVAPPSAPEGPAPEPRVEPEPQAKPPDAPPARRTERPSTGPTRAERPSRSRPSSSKRPTRSVAREARAAQRSGSASRRVGYLVINTIPWADIFVDGRNTRKRTPQLKMRVRAGKRVIGLRTPDGTMHRVEVEVSPGETVRIIKRF